MDGVQFDITMVTGGSGAAIDSIVGGLTDITNHLNTLNQNFIGFSQKSLSGFQAVNTEVKKTESSFDKLSRVSFGLNNISQGLSGMTSDLEAAVEPGIKLNSSLKDLQAITGVTDAQMEKIGLTARKNAVEFGTSAANGVESYKVFLSKLGPELANSEAALNGFGRNAAILSKQMKGDTAGAAELLSSAMNQFAVSIKNPTEALKAQTAMMNIMSAAAQEGSAELPQIKSAIEESGAMAKTSGLNFAELNAAIQVVGKSGSKYGAEGGVAIRNALAEMNQGLMNSPKTIEMLEAAGINVQKLSDRSLSFSDRMRMLAPIANDAAAMTQLFGVEGVIAGMAFAQNTDELDRMTGKINNTTSATDMAKTVMGSYEERVNRIKAKINDFGISIFDATKEFMPFITIGMGTVQVMANMAQAGVLVSTITGSTMVKSIASYIAGLFVQTSATTAATGAQEGLNVAMSLNPVGFIITGIALLTAGLVVAYNKSETFRAVLNGIFEVGKLLYNVFEGVGKVLIGAFSFNPKMLLEGMKQTASAAAEIANGGIGKAFNKGFDDSMAESKKKAEMDKATSSAAEGVTSKINIAIPGITEKGNPTKAGALQNYDPHKKKDKTGKEMSSNITAGGSRPTTIHLTIQKVIGIGELKTTNLVGAAKEAGNQVVEEVLMALQSVNGKVSTQ
jgi:TP901 family phage tail tape measure protein